MNVGTIVQRDINVEVQRAYLDYAMSVIVARALPDVRDGLKPVQRRILFAMHDMGLRPGSPYKKSARIVGEVLGKYHPHGDSAVYEAMARMAQDFSMRYPLVDGQGNFGSVDGDAPAAMRYTEARMAAIAAEALTDIDKQTVDWADNFDGSLREPTVLPSRLPNLLLNGAAGIAVGMSTNIPPHNLGEIVDALVYLLDQWAKIDDVTVADLMRYVQGPDFPTGGLVYRRESEDGEDVLLKAYATGRGRITIHARAHIEQAARGRQRIIITELPYQVNKSTLITNIAKLVRSGKLEGIADLRDESDRQGMRVVIELLANADTDEVLQSLYRRTALESRYSIIILALVNGEPRRLSLKRALLLFLEHRLEVLVRRVRYDLTHAQQRLHIVEGLLIALEHLDEVISTIRRSRTVDTARKNLRRKFKLSEAQAQAILEMPLKRLAALERRKLQDEARDLRKQIAAWEQLLASPKQQRATIRAELLSLREQYADARRTHIQEVKSSTLAAVSLTPDQPVWVTVGRHGQVGRQPLGDKPRAVSRPAEPPLALLAASTRDTLYLFTADGQAAALPVHQVPEGTAWNGEGTHWSTLAHAGGADIVDALTLPALPPDGTLFIATAHGQVKRLNADQLPPVGRAPQPLIRLAEKDRVIGAVWVTAKDEVILGTAAGQGIRFSAADVRPSGSKAGGVNGIRLSDGDHVVGLSVITPRGYLITVSDLGMAKRTPLTEFPSQRRGGKGVQIAKLDPQEHLAGIGIQNVSGRCFLATERGAAKTLTVRAIKERKRAAHGVSVIALRAKDRVTRLIAPRTGERGKP